MLFCLGELDHCKCEIGMSCIWKFTHFADFVQCHVMETWAHGSVDLMEKYVSFYYVWVLSVAEASAE